ncbi:unnamed protein product [Calicophoron daubneyi]|uniref:PiggyBac transposable element-derived protein 4 C-terminal zinc-finger domain-containing protein n=1 Tax=Calicophoron daubneyi TaxID=300641 RepID=A0AAV2SZ79_CALDB
MTSRSFLRLFATAIQNASALSNEMRLAELSTAFKMACELQTHIVDIIFTRSRQLGEAVTASNIPIKQEPGVETSVSEAEIVDHHRPSVSVTEDVCDSSTHPSNSVQQPSPDTEPVHDTPHHEISQENVSEGEATSMDAEHTEQTPNTSPALQNPNHRNESASPEVSQQQHRLVALETLHSAIPNSVPHDKSTWQLPCAACHLRLRAGFETLANMVCAACPDQPPICSAQCFRWWHNQISSSCNHVPSLTSESAPKPPERRTDRKSFGSLANHAPPQDAMRAVATRKRKLRQRGRKRITIVKKSGIHRKGGTGRLYPRTKASEARLPLLITNAPACEVISVNSRLRRKRTHPQKYSPGKFAENYLTADTHF